ncbi:hypothetical protein FA10DRAFT_263047 [Acaromyces ingoldii]|uniref:Xylanolytic transcriptional activator regulatory domain-containing protein n=1 Tax=Acaromyces ingoldii TaxID=215250 RepID=A0A316YAA6_9BASI|nr:hypothetical protein FA10DRAFT_263047 [Acaromyces ingoldii]PWN86780.1 hypothetical protein FA10DRAFT_263047 [Acaromyces ingoldii]
MGVACQEYFDTTGEEDIGGVNPAFQHGDRCGKAEILTTGLITRDEASELFDIFFNSCAQHLCILDPTLYTPTMTLKRSVFLYTCICAIASRYYESPLLRKRLRTRPAEQQLYHTLSNICERLASVCVFQGHKSVEIAQGLALLCLWRRPCQRFDFDNAWTFSGLARCMATDLDLQRGGLLGREGRFDSTSQQAQTKSQPPTSSREQDMETLNRQRCYLLIFAIDRSMSAQMGKAYLLRESSLVRGCESWCQQELSAPWDVAVSAFADLYCILSNQIECLNAFTNRTYALSTANELHMTLSTFNAELDRWKRKWEHRGLVQPTDVDDMGGVDYDPYEKWSTTVLVSIRKQFILRLEYAKLIINSYGVQHSMKSPLEAGSPGKGYFDICFQSAKNVVQAVEGEMRASLRYSPDIQAYNLVEGAVKVLDDIAVDSDHCPALYAAFLRSIVDSYHGLLGSVREVGIDKGSDHQVDAQGRSDHRHRRSRIGAASSGALPIAEIGHADGQKTPFASDAWASFESEQTTTRGLAPPPFPLTSITSVARSNTISPSSPSLLPEDCNHSTAALMGEPRPDQLSVPPSTQSAVSNSCLENDASARFTSVMSSLQESELSLECILDEAYWSSLLLLPQGASSSFHFDGYGGDEFVQAQRAASERDAS